jgi:hypothetical protein
VKVWTKKFAKRNSTCSELQKEVQPVFGHIISRATVPSWNSPYRLAQFPGYRGKLFIALNLNFTYKTLRGCHVGAIISAVGFDRWFCSLVFTIILLLLLNSSLLSLLLLLVPSNLISSCNNLSPDIEITLVIQR